MKTRLAAIIIGILSLYLSGAQAADDLSKLSIVKQPAELIAGIYQAFHDWQVDAGIALTTRSLVDLDGYLKNNPEMEIADANLKTKKVKQIASSLHTLLGMLDQRLAMKLLDDESQRKARRIEELTGSHGKIATVDIDSQLLVEKASAQLSASAVKEFREAIEVDPANPSPHYELAKTYAQGLPGSATAAAEDEYYLAAVCALDEGDSTAASSTMRTLATLNPKSKYLARFEGRARSGIKGE